MTEKFESLSDDKIDLVDAHAKHTRPDEHADAYHIQQDHQDLVRRLKKSPEQIFESFGDDKLDMVHMMMGLSGEVGELMDTIKKHTIYDQALDYKNVLEELGDVEFYLEGLRQILDVNRQETLALNIYKLNARYPAGRFSDAHARERLDKDVSFERPSAEKYTKLLDRFLTTREEATRALDLVNNLTIEESFPEEFKTDIELIVEALECTLAAGTY